MRTTELMDDFDKANVLLGRLIGTSGMVIFAAWLLVELLILYLNWREMLPVIWNALIEAHRKKSNRAND